MYFFTKNKNHHPKHTKLIELDTTPIADLSFNLLIFFIVTASFILRQGVFLSLPPVNAAAIKVEISQTIEIYPQNDGFIIEGKSVDRTQLLNFLSQKKANQKDLIAIIYMKPNIKYDRLVDTLSAIKESDLSKISLKYIE